MSEIQLEAPSPESLRTTAAVWAGGEKREIARCFCQGRQGQRGTDGHAGQSPLLRVWLLVTHDMDPVVLMAEALLGGRGDQGLLQGRHLNCRDVRELPKTPSNGIFGSSSLFFPAHVSAVEAVPAKSCFFVPRTPFCQGSQTPSYPLCAWLCPADKSWEQDTAQGHVSVWKSYRTSHISPRTPQK